MKELARITRILKFSFALFVALPVLYAMLSTSGTVNLVLPLETPAAAYICQVAGVFMALLAVPFALTLFNKLLKAKVMAEQSLTKAMQHYLLLSVLRLALLSLAAAFNLLLYFSQGQRSSIGLLCFFICALAFAFCVPTAKRVKNDLDLGD